jgi:hypothetical protein
MLALLTGTVGARRWIDANTRWVVSGSRLLQNHRAVILESGSPPGLGQLVRLERLQTYRVHFSPFKRPAFLSFSSSNPATRSDGPPASLREALRAGVLECGNSARSPNCTPRPRLGVAHRCANVNARHRKASIDATPHPGSNPARSRQRSLLRPGRAEIFAPPDLRPTVRFKRMSSRREFQERSGVPFAPSLFARRSRSHEKLVTDPETDPGAFAIRLKQGGHR